MRRLVPTSTLLLGALVGAAGCCRAASPTPASVVETPEPSRALRALDAPFALPPELLAAERRRLVETTALEAIPAEPAVGGQGPVVVAPDPDRPFVALDRFLELAFHHEPEPGARGREIVSHARLLAREPWALVSEDGTLAIRFETVRPVARARAYVGPSVAEDPLGLPRSRDSSAELRSEEGGLSHEIRVGLAGLLVPRYDVGRWRQAGRGTVAFLLDVLDDETSTVRSWEGRVSFRCDETPCEGETPRLVQLPTFRLGPVVDLVGPDRATVSFETDAATVAVVVARAGDGELLRFPSAAPGTRHEVALEGLRPDTRYAYHALAVDRRGEVVASRGASFLTEPAEGDRRPFSFVLMSDSRSGVGSGDHSYVGTNRRVLHGLLVAAMAEDPRLVVFVGDLVDGFTTEPSAYRFELEAWIRVIEPFGAFVPLYEGVGNHETLVRGWEAGWAVDRPGDESAEAVFADVFVNPTNGPAPHRPEAPTYLENVYSFDSGEVHVAVVNSNYWFRSHIEREDHPAGFGLGQREGWVNETILAWLDEDLAAARARGARHLVVCTHEPAFPAGGHAKDAMYWNGRIPEVLAMRDRFVGLLGRHGVTLLFTGDEHNYSRTWIDGSMVEGLERPLWQVISGGAGAPYYAQDTSLPWTDHVRVFDARQHYVLVRVDGDGFVVEARSLEGAILDRFDAGAGE